MCPIKISGICNEEISRKKLCILSAMKHGTPSTVHEISSDATVAQICQICKLYESHDDCGFGHAAQFHRVLSRCNRGRQIDIRHQVSHSPQRKFVLDRMKDIKTEAKTASKKLDLFHIDFPVPTPVGGG